MRPTQASSGLTISFPNVCKLPSSPAPFVPIPYPSFAKTAVKNQKKTGMTLKKAPVTLSKGSEPGTLKSVVSSTNKGPVPVVGAPAVSGEISMIRGALAQLHNKLSSMSSSDPNEWQKVLQDYAVTASALFVTLNKGDDD